MTERPPAAEPGGAEALADGVWLLPFAAPFPPFTQNAVAIDEGAAGWTVIDPGLRSNEAGWRAHAVGLLGGRPIRRVIVTHFHPDHIGLAGWMRAVFGAEIWTTRTSWLAARMLQLDGWTTPPEAARAFQRRAGFDAAMLARYEARAAQNFSVTVAPLPIGFRRIVAGERIAIGGRPWRVLVGDGHAPEHALLLDESRGLLIAGDQVLPTISPNIGVYPIEPEADPLGEWLESCARLGVELGDDLLAAPGHGPAFRGVSSRLGAIAAKHGRMLERLAAHLAEAPRTAVGCWPALYARPIDAGLEGLATVEAIAHLNRLTAEGRAVRTTRADGVYEWRST